eukprot:4559200-Pyramimonas_sp.AAC.1
MSIQSANVIIQTKGGLRDGDCAAAAWIIGLCGRIDGQGIYATLMVHGTFLELPCTVFRAEAIALDEASRAAQSILTE